MLRPRWYEWHGAITACAGKQDGPEEADLIGFSVLRDDSLSLITGLKGRSWTRGEP